jgi:hypothetical protein
MFEASVIGEMILNAQRNDELAFPADYTVLGHDILQKVFPRPDKMTFKVLNHTIELVRSDEGSTINTDLRVQVGTGISHEEDEQYNRMIDGFESLLLALFDAGALSYTQPTITAITSALEAISNHS